MEQKPANIIYGVDDIPPLRASLLLAFQHAGLALAFLVYPLILVSEAHGTQADAEAIVTASILAIAAGTFLQCYGRKGIGSGFLAVHITNPVYLPVSLYAAGSGGLGLVFGMTIIAGIFGALFSRILRRQRHLFPAEVCGVGIVMLGISMTGSAVTRFLGLRGTGHVDPNAVAVAAVSLVLMVALSVWTKGRLRLYSVLIGLAGGYAAALGMGVADPAALSSVLNDGFFALPAVAAPGWKFQWAMLVPFLLTSLIASLDSVAGIVTCQKINQSEWVRPEMGSIGRGILADGAGTALSGVLGSIGTGISTAHVALTSATGATARRIGLLTAALLLVTAFVPPVAKLLSRMPTPVIGAILVYTAAFLITSGMELITSRMLDSRRVFMVGFSIIAGLSVLQFPELFTHSPHWFSSVFGSPFAVAAICAFVLNLLFRIGTSRSATVRIEPQIVDIAEVRRFFENRCALWGARRQVVNRMEAAVNELLETVIIRNLATGPIDLRARFDEYNIDVVVLYPGRAISMSVQQPTPEEILDDDGAVMRLSAMLIRQYADRVAVETHNDQQRILLHFEH
jgi:NCS2 family nucleobase:cation symporter-2